MGFEYLLTKIEIGAYGIGCYREGWAELTLNISLKWLFEESSFGMTKILFGVASLIREKRDSTSSS